MLKKINKHPLGGSEQVGYFCWEFFVLGVTTALDGQLYDPNHRGGLHKEHWICNLDIWAYPGWEQQQAQESDQEFEIDTQLEQKVSTKWEDGSVYTDKDGNLLIPAQILTPAVVEEAIKRWYVSKYPRGQQQINCDFGEPAYPESFEDYDFVTTLDEAKQLVQQTEERLLTKQKPGRD